MNIHLLQRTPTSVSFKAEKRIVGHKGSLAQRRQQQPSRIQRLSPCKALEIDWTSADTLIGLAGERDFQLCVSFDFLSASLRSGVKGEQSIAQHSTVMACVACLLTLCRMRCDWHCGVPVKLLSM
jgi:hypothetical protein